MSKKLRKPLKMQVEKSFKKKTISLNLSNAVFKKALVVAIGYFIAATAFGIYATQLNVHWAIVISLSIFVFAGASQFLAVKLMASAVDPVSIILSGLFLNLRHLIYSTLFLKDIKSSDGKVGVKAALLTDEVFGLFQTETDRSQLQEVEVFVYLGWIGGTLVGVLFGSFLPKIESLDFVLTALFTVLAVDAIEELRKVENQYFPALLSAGIFIVVSSIVLENALLYSMFLVILCLPLLQRIKVK